MLSGFAAHAATAEEGAGASSAIYKRYKLSEEKTFASFFHPDKDPILGLVDQFQEKRGKFGIPGYPQKLGFLLYGPPGTGKVSTLLGRAVWLMHLLLRRYVQPACCSGQLSPTVVSIIAEK